MRVLTIKRIDQCNLPVNQQYQITVAGVGSLLVEHHLWVGTAGAGFVAPVRVSGTWRGQSVDITHYEQLTVGYARHAFTADIHIMFDQAIDGEYGIRIDNYVSDFDSPQGWTLNAEGETETALSNVTSVLQE